jgi:hypothetical protein
MVSKKSLRKPSSLEEDVPIWNLMARENVAKIKTHLLWIARGVTL